MIRRIDRLAVELPPPSEPDPAGAQAVQELMGGRFGEMSTFMNYTIQSFNFRNRQGARPFYDLVANIAAEEFGHMELVATAINTMLTGASPADDGRAPKASLVPLKGVGNPHHFLAGGQGALLSESPDPRSRVPSVVLEITVRGPIAPSVRRAEVVPSVAALLRR